MPKTGRNLNLDTRQKTPIQCLQIKLAHGKIADIQGNPQVRILKMCGESRMEI